MITAENIRRAATALWDNDIAPELSGDYESDLQEIFDDAVTDFIENSFDPEDFNEEEYPEDALPSGPLEDCAAELGDHICGEIESARDNGAADESISRHVIWTSDIMEYYESNQLDCDSYLSELVLHGYDSISDIVSACVSYARMSEVYGDLSNMIQWVEDSDNFARYLD